MVVLDEEEAEGEEEMYIMYLSMMGQGSLTTGRTYSSILGMFLFVYHNFMASRPKDITFVSRCYERPNNRTFLVQANNELSYYSQFLNFSSLQWGINAINFQCSSGSLNRQYGNFTNDNDIRVSHRWYFRDIQMHRRWFPVSLAVVHPSESLMVLIEVNLNTLHCNYTAYDRLPESFLLKVFRVK